LAWLEAHGVTTTATRGAQGLDGHASWPGFEAAVAAAGKWMQQRESLGEWHNIRVCNGQNQIGLTGSDFWQK
jgi:hypothetical protein